MFLNWNKSIFRKLLFSSMITVLLGLCAVGLVISFLAKDGIVDSKGQELLRQAKRVNLAIQNRPAPDESFKELLLFFDQSYDARIWVFNKEGNIVSTSSKDEVNAGKSVNGDIVRQVTAGEEAVWSFRLDGQKEEMLSVAVPWGKDNSVYGGIVMYAPMTRINETISHLRENILWVTLLGMLFSFTVSSYLSWSISRPLQKIDKAAAKIASGDYSEPILIRSKDELGELASTFNEMMEKLGRVEGEKRKLDQLRHDFLANVSHELRTPLTAMQGFLEALQDGIIEAPFQDRYYEIMYQETLHMNRLVDDITDLMKLENREIVLTRTAVELEPLLRKLAFKFRQEADARGTVLQTVVADGLPMAYADPDRLKQILNNLVMNAVKFTENGSVELKAEAGSDGRTVLITVTDTGIGISEEDRELIWERFFKVDRGRPRKNKGSGLGLAIVRELVELHQGSIRVESEVGQGSCFQVHLPAVDAGGRSGDKGKC
ncbi:ATP-binding protein [Gorillibacterium sp. sgz5001074]|uniref:sensor histidine kinase n=1 Tax=Gorillibacterium sp. sgz5001074 TaxID=3446695 RepID=UPI003F67DFF4